jgi:hypothetical protein
MAAAEPTHSSSRPETTIFWERNWDAAGDRFPQSGGSHRGLTLFKNAGGRAVGDRLTPAIARSRWHPEALETARA